MFSSLVCSLRCGVDRLAALACDVAFSQRWGGLRLYLRICFILDERGGIGSIGALSPPHLSYFRSLSLARVTRSNACTRKLSRAHAQTHKHQVRGRRRMAMAHIPVAKRLLHLPRTARPPAPSSGQQSRFGETACVGCRILLRSAAERVARYRYVAIMPMLKLFYSEQVRWTLSAGGRIRILLTAHAVGRRRRLRKVIQS